MKKLNQKGYALLIVLFLIVFIMTVTAVFMRSSVSNAFQKKTVDENNLVVVAAEAGVDYYTWELRKVYDEKELEAEFTRLVEEAIVRKEKPENYYISIQEMIADDFKEKLKKRIEVLEKEKGIELFSNYNHSFKADVERTYHNGDIWLIVKGVSIGNYPKTSDMKNSLKELSFDLVFIIPKVQEDDESDSEGNTDGPQIMMPDLKEPKTPSLPDAITAIKKQKTDCKPSNRKIVNQQCNSSNISEANYSINQSSVYIVNTLNSWGQIDLENSYVNILQNFTPAGTKVEATELVVGNKIEAYQAVNFNNSKVQAKELHNSGGKATISNSHMTIVNSLTFQVAELEDSFIRANSFLSHNDSTFNTTHLSIAANYQSGATRFNNSNVVVGGSVSTGGGLISIIGSNVKIIGDAKTGNGSTIKNSILQIGGSFVHTSKSLDAENSDVLVEGNIDGTNGTSLKNVNMKVLGYYRNSEIFKLSDTNFYVNGLLTLGNGGELENSLLIAKNISSSTLIDLDGSVVYADNIKSDRMTMKDSKVCAKDFNVRELRMDKSSRVYYSNTFNFNKYNSSFPVENVLQIPTEELEKTCGGMSSTPSGSIKWKNPFLNKVEY